LREGPLALYSQAFRRRQPLAAGASDTTAPGNRSRDREQGAGHTLPVLENSMSMSEQLGLLGRKVGMMRIFTDDGDTIPVTVLDVSNNRVTQVKTAATDGYDALQVAFGSRKASRITKPAAGHLAKAGVEPAEVLREFRVAATVAGQYQPGAALPVTLFAAGQKVDVQGTSIGKGFAGTIKRHNFRSQRASHGNSRSHNVPGSISMAQDPGRVFPGKKMTGHMGDETVTTQNLDIVRVDEARSLLLVRGAVPGAKNGHVVVRPAVKVRVAKGGAAADVKKGA
jgi:large subunit ribosomal protein L3